MVLGELVLYVMVFVVMIAILYFANLHSDGLHIGSGDVVACSIWIIVLNFVIFCGFHDEMVVGFFDACVITISEAFWMQII